MMKLSLMKEVMSSIDEEWRSPLAEEIVEKWEYDKETVFFFRASANFVFVFRKDGKTRFLRCNHSSERDLQTFESEVQILHYLGEQGIHAAQPIKSLQGNYVETAETEYGTFYAVVFEGLDGKQFDIEEIDAPDYFNWGKALGKLHSAMIGVPERLRGSRKSWKDHLNFVRETLPIDETSTINELHFIESWANNLPVFDELFGLIHYDFELDNLCWEDELPGILDFDDCSLHWFVADIAFALRDLFEGEVRFSNPLFQEFLKGYKTEKEINDDLLQELPLFYRLHNLVLYGRLLRSVDLYESPDHPEWLNGLIKKFHTKIESLRSSFAMNPSRF